MNVKQARAMLTSISKSTGTKHSKVLISELCVMVKFLLDELDRIKSPPMSKLEQVPRPGPYELTSRTQLARPEQPVLRPQNYPSPKQRSKDNAGGQNNMDFIKLQLSTGLMHDEQGKTIGLVCVFRPDIVVKDQHWFEHAGINPHLICIETGSDGFPINCKKIFPNLDGPSECERLTDDEILEIFKNCCKLLSKGQSEIQNFDDTIFKGMVIQ